MQASLQLQCRLGAPRLSTSVVRTPLQRAATAPFHRTGLRAPSRRTLTTQANLGGFDALLHGAVGSAVPSSLDSLAAYLTTAMFLADIADPTGAVDAAAAVADTAAKKGGFMSFFSDAFESFLKLIDAGLDGAGVPYSYGFSIIVITVLVKLATYPLSKKQVESTLSMQALQPRVKDLQAKYANDPERLQVETAKLYQTAGVNPLAGCLPTLATIPVFIGLYRALSNVADEGLLTEGFFWIPSLAGPTKLNGGLDWLIPHDGVPPLGWGPTVAYLVMPVLLVVSQYASQKIISPQNNTDPSQQQTQAILKFIPLMIGWFSLNVPSGLTLYWFTNNLITTAQQVYLRKKFMPEAEAAAAAPLGTTTIVKPRAAEERRTPSGKDLGARRSKSSGAYGDIIDVEATSVGGDGPGAKFAALKAAEQAKKGGGASVATSAASSAAAAAAEKAAGERFRAIKAREAAMKAAEQAAGAAPAAVEVESAAPAVAVAEHAQEEGLQVPDAAPAKNGAVEAKPKAAGSRGKSSGKKGGKKK